MSDFVETAALNHFLRATGAAVPATVYAALFTSAPGDAGTGTEVSGGAYARQAMAFAAPSGGSSSNSGVVTFPTATANWGTVTHLGIYDAVTGGNLLFWGALATSKVVNTGDTPKFNAADVIVTLD